MKNQKMKKIRNILMLLATLTVALLIAMPVFAADPITAITNFGNNLGKLISAAGTIVLLIGVVVIALGLASHDPSQKMTGGIVAAAGALLAFAPAVVSWFSGSVYLLPVCNLF